MYSDDRSKAGLPGPEEHKLLMATIGKTTE
jgi:hypothetical protein